MARIEISGVPTTPQKVKVGKKVENLVIHDVYILDASGSMGFCNREGTKAYNALHGCYDNLVASSKDENALVLSTVCVFSESYTINIPYLASKVTPSLETIESCFDRGMTALYDAIGKTVTSLEKKVSDGELVNVKIFTDGGENGSRKYKASGIKKLITSKEKVGWTFAFVGTPQDVYNVQRNLAIDSSNTLEYDGTAEGFNKTMIATQDSMESYSKSASRGEDVSRGFYKDIK